MHLLLKTYELKKYINVNGINGKSHTLAMTGTIFKLGKNEHQVWKFMFISFPFSLIVHNSQNSNSTASKRAAAGEEREHDPQKLSKNAFSENRSIFFFNLRKTDLKKQ